MINLLESIDFYLQKGYEDAYATAKVAQDIKQNCKVEL